MIKVAQMMTQGPTPMNPGGAPKPPRMKPPSLNAPPLAKPNMNVPDPTNMVAGLKMKMKMNNPFSKTPPTMLPSDLTSQAT